MPSITEQIDLFLTQQNAIKDQLERWEKLKHTTNEKQKNTILSYLREKEIWLMQSKNERQRLGRTGLSIKNPSPDLAIVLDMLAKSSTPYLDEGFGSAVEPELIKWKLPKKPSETPLEKVPYQLEKSPPLLETEPTTLPSAKTTQSTTTPVVKNAVFTSPINNATGTITPSASNQPIPTSSMSVETQLKETVDNPKVLQGWINMEEEEEVKVAPTVSSVIDNKATKDHMMAEEVKQIESIAPPVATSQQGVLASLYSMLPSILPTQAPPSHMVTAPASHFNTPPPLAQTPEGQPQEMQTVEAEPLPTTSDTETHKPNTNAWGFTNWNNAPASEWEVDPATGQVTTKEKAKQSTENFENWWKTSTNAPRRDIHHRFGDYKIAPTRSPLISTDKAVGILPFPEAYEPWKYISHPRPYMLSSSLNKYQYYPSFHQAQNLKTTIGVR